MSLLRNTFNLLSKLQPTNTIHLFHTLIKPTPVQSLQLLQPQSVVVSPVCGLKVKGHVRRRCKDCYLVWRENRLYNMCKTHGRHKQMSMVKDPRNTWILTHATQGTVRPW